MVRDEGAMKTVRWVADAHGDGLVIVLVSEPRRAELKVAIGD